MNLNLGCGNKILPGFVNVDKFNVYEVDIVHDLEVFPYPFEDNSVDIILLSHVLEHIGQTPDIFNNIIRELYRICKNDAKIEINVPHPRHDDFLADPTHVRPITYLGLSLYDQELNKQWEQLNAANSPLGLIHKVNFKIEKHSAKLDPFFQKKFENKEITREEINDLALHNNNVLKETQFVWKVIK
mgnify:CR=1 FL=1